MLELIVNTAMIAEVSIRLVAFGKVSRHGRSSPHVPRAERPLTRSSLLLGGLSPATHTEFLEVVLQHVGPGRNGALRRDHPRHLLLGLLSERRGSV